MRHFLTCGLFLLCAAGAAQAQLEIRFGTPAADFPPGPFTDGNSYQLSDFQGKVVVLFFFETDCPRCKGMVPERNAIVQALKDKPIKFIAIGPGDTLAEVAAYQRETKLAMPIFADSWHLMEKRYGFQNGFEISLKNIYQIRVFDPDGKLVGVDMKKESLEKIIEQTKAQWKYKGQGYDAKLEPALDACEWGQYAQGMKLLAPLRKSTNKALAESASKLFNAVKQDGETWKAEAAKVEADDPIKAYDLYAKVSAAFGGDELARSVAEPMKKLAATKAVSAELAARKAFATLLTNLGKPAPAQKPLALKACQEFAKKHAGTPTGEKAAGLAKELGG